MDRKAAAQAIDAFLRALGLDPQREGELAGTGNRVASAYADELCDGYGVDVGALLSSGAIANTGKSTQVVVLRDAQVVTMCPHHLMPGIGVATVAFAPGAKLVGLGTLAALVDVYAHRLTLQETVGEGVVGAVMEHLAPVWAGCRLLMTHTCLVARGERKHGARAESVALAGIADAEARRTALMALGVGT